VSGRFRLRFPPSEIRHWAGRYSDPNDPGVDSLVPSIRRAGHLTKGQLLTVCRWKSPRSAGRAERNHENFVQETTRIALSTPEERLRVGALTLLDGVSWPTASVILHFFHRDVYPILDYRALWSLGLSPPSQYGFDFWWLYTLECRRLAQEAPCAKRDLDRALWQYSKEHQPAARS
jgi:hypothetical protein